MSTTTTTFPAEYYKKVIDTLLSQAELLKTEHDPEKILVQTLELLSHFLNLRKGRIFLWDTQSENLVIRYSHGLTRQQINVGKYQISEGITGEVLESGRAALISNVQENPQYKGKVYSLDPNHEKPSSYIAIPITDNGNDLGVLAVDCTNTNDGDIEAYGIVLKLVADMFAKIIHKYELNEFALHDVA